MSEQQRHIDALLEEKRLFPPPPGFVDGAVVDDPEVYERAAADPEGFWAEQAERLEWSRAWDTVMEWTPPTVKWFVGGTLNVSVNCLDRHVAAEVLEAFVGYSIEPVVADFQQRQGDLDKDGQAALDDLQQFRQPPGGVLAHAALAPHEVHRVRSGIGRHDSDSFPSAGAEGWPSAGASADVGARGARGGRCGRPARAWLR